MPAYNNYYPIRIGDQIIWLRNFSNKLPGYKMVLGYDDAEMAAILADCAAAIYTLETWQPGVQQFAQAATTRAGLILNGPDGGNSVIWPNYAAPSEPPAPAPVNGGALKRIFAFIAAMKKITAFTDAIGEDLGTLGSVATEDPAAIPPVDAKVIGGQVIITFKKMGHMGVWVEGQTGSETDWTFLAIDTSNPYNDTRPLKVAGQPEKRRYRLCFWDGDPTKVWTDVIEVTFGG